MKSKVIILGKINRNFEWKMETHQLEVTAKGKDCAAYLVIG